jgi:hypothetical protein
MGVAQSIIIALGLAALGVGISQGLTQAGAAIGS